eukprot:6117045-Pleurochrysis_carterae.AAC.1
MSEAAGASRKQLRQVAAVTGAVRVQIVKVSACPMSADVSAIAETNAISEAYMSSARRTLRLVEAKACRKHVEETAAASTHDDKVIVARKASVRIDRDGEDGVSVSQDARTDVDTLGLGKDR